MATLAAISFTLVGGIASFGAAMTAFGYAVKRRSVFVAARCVARPRNVIYNPKPDHPSQNRGDPTLGWIMWVMRLTYDTMLRGVPGTGTRDGGLSGALLKVNLDGVVLLRFHHMCLRVCFLAAILYLIVVLPLYKTAQCSRIGKEDDEAAATAVEGYYEENYMECQHSNLTDYQRLTLANIPTLAPPKTERFADIFYSFFLPVHDGLLARLYAVVFCAWIVTWYALRELQYEWTEVLAMRRVYYLEADHWSDRNEELNETLLREEREKKQRQKKAFHKKKNNKKGRGRKKDNDNDEDNLDNEYMKDREPWIPHPEQRDTVPNVELYSILVGGLPSLPTEVVDQEEVDAVFSRKQSIDWQLTVTTAFFDHCVPNQPGFSSSVAAVTILPAADQLTEAWNHWYKAASKLRRLRFIRKQIAERRRFDIDEDAYPEDEPDESSPSVRRQQQVPSDPSPTVYSESKTKQQYFQEVLGSDNHLDVESDLLHTLDFGPEQTAVYSREFALGAANLAPNGWFEGQVLRAGIDELLEMEKEALKEVHEANQELKQAQGKIAESSSGDDEDNEFNDDHLDRFMKTASRHSSILGGSFDRGSDTDDSDNQNNYKNNVNNKKENSEKNQDGKEKDKDDKIEDKDDDDVNSKKDDQKSESSASIHSKELESPIHFTEPLKGESGPARSTTHSRISSATSEFSSGEYSSDDLDDSFAQASGSLRVSSHDRDIETGEVVPPPLPLERAFTTPVKMSSRNTSSEPRKPFLNRTSSADVPGRFSLAAAGKQMSTAILHNSAAVVSKSAAVMSKSAAASKAVVTKSAAASKAVVTKSAAAVSSLPGVSSIIPQRSSSTTERPRRMKRASITSTNLPSDLGLEAGLFMEQRNLSLGTSQHMSRGSSRMRRRASGDTMASHESLNGRRRKPRRTRSDEDIDDYSGEMMPRTSTRSAPRRSVRRAKSWDDVELFDAEDDIESGRRPTTDSMSLKNMQKALKANPDLPNPPSYDDSRGKRRAPRRARSDDGVEDYMDESAPQRSASRDRPPNVRRAKSWDEVDLYDVEDDIVSSHKSDAVSVSLKDMQKALKKEKTEKPKKIANTKHEDASHLDTNDDKEEDEGTIAARSFDSSSAGSGSIWDRLEKDKQRKSRLRAKLDSMQSLQNTPSTESGNSGSSDDLPVDVPGVAISSLEYDEAPSPPPRKPASSPGRFNGASGESTVPPVFPSRSWNAEGEEVAKENYNSNAQTTPSISGTIQPADRTHRKKGSFDGKNHPMLMSAIDENDSNSESSFIMDGLPMPGTMPPPHHHHDCHESKRSMSSHTIVDDNLRIAFNFEENAGLRERERDQGPRRRLNTNTTDKWSKVVSIIKESDRKGETSKGRKIASGKWKVLTPKQIFWKIHNRVMKILGKSTELLTKPDLVDELARHSNYAVVTFTSRQAAVAARHCLADSRGADRWVTVGEIPSPPLADAPVCNMSSFRGCVRPVTLSISDKQKILRHNLAIGALATVYFFYTIPLTAAQQLVSPENLSRLIPDILEWQENSLFVANIFSGFIPALVWTGFFAICPPMFKIISNFGSNATSSVIAENKALHYFWWFMVVSAFTGASLSTAIVNGFNEGIQIGAEIQQVIESTAAAIPTQVSATWLNWLIVRVSIVLPTQYLLQLNTFVFSFFGLTCCARVVRGGGSGGPVPYRIYVDSGVVMLCLFGLAPASPLIAPAAFIYFLFCTPMLRWTMIFLYKPKFDIGGQRFPFIFDMCVSGMIVGQVLLVAMMTLKRAFGPAFVAFCPMIPTLLYRYILRRRYLRAFSDAALLQTSLLDGWDTNEETCVAKREEFRKFLVDCHKAAYVPVCIASGDLTTSITAEPAVVVPTEADEDFGDTESHYGETSESAHGNESKMGSLPSKASQQPGGFVRRTTVAQPGQMLRRASVAPKPLYMHDDFSMSERRISYTSPEQAPNGFPSPRHAHNKSAQVRDFTMSERLPGPVSHNSSFASPRQIGRRRVMGSGPKSPVRSPKPSRGSADITAAQAAWLNSASVPSL